VIINGRISFRRRRLLMISDGRSIFLGTATASVSDEEKQSSRCLRLWSRSRSSIRWRLPGCKLPTKQSLVAGYCDGKKCPQETFVRTISRATSKFATQTLPQLGQLTSPMLAFRTGRVASARSRSRVVTSVNFQLRAGLGYDACPPIDGVSRNRLSLGSRSSHC
jgi:hypothetical protein